MTIGLFILEDLSDKYRLYGVCNACHRMDRLNLFSLVTRLGSDFPIGQVKTRLKCGECRSKDCGIRIVWVGKAEYAYGNA
jgi:hypothetical protein